ncbi:MAG TPA: DUF5916 domain-containing protein [Vicinamibacterales bacterium]|nr:DUF5916 domain-containing protein [Vicinamibacterales bacterium]
MVFPLFAGLLLSIAGAAPEHNGREGSLDVSMPRLEASVEVDGTLDEPAWAQAAALTGFSQYAPVDGRPSAQETSVLAWYSPTAIHFGIRAAAPPGSVRATLADRDRLDTEDQIQIYLGTFNDGRQAFMFAVNPLGVQADGALTEGTRGVSRGFDGLETGREEVDLSPDFVFQSRGRLTEAGYEVEIRIPFKSLRYQSADPQDWSIHVIRLVQSNGHEDSWAPARRAAASFLAQAGRLRGLTDLRRGLVLDLNPAVTSRIDGERQGGRWDYAGGRPEFGGNVRWGLTANLTLNGTINPDFSQVEADAGQFVFDPRAALFFAEKRPFFLDGIEQFATPNNLIYTRRIVSPLASAKVTGRIGATSVALLTAVDDETTSATGSHPFFTIARVQRNLNASTRAALVYTDRIDGDDSNRVLAADTRVTFRKLYRLQAQGAVSRTVRGDEPAIAPLWDISLNRDGRRFGFLYSLRAIDDDFRADSGFLSRVGIALATVDHRITFYGRRGAPLESWTTDVVLDGTWQYDDFVSARGAQDRKLHINNNVILRGGWRATGSVLVETFGYDEDLYAGYALRRTHPDGTSEILPFTGTPDLGNLDYVVQLSTPRFSTVSASVFLLWGHDENFFEWSSSDILFARYSADWRPTQQLRINPQYQVQQYRRRTDGSLVGRRRIPRLKVEYQLTRAIFLRWIGEYDANEQDDLRDDSRTGLPIVIMNRATGEYELARAFRRNQFRNDWLFSYQPTPGTVIFAGYGSTTSEPRPLRFADLTRVRDGFFLKVSYLFRL